MGCSGMFIQKCFKTGELFEKSIVWGTPWTISRQGQTGNVHCSRDVQNRVFLKPWRFTVQQQQPFR
eukprot:3294660-Amphidinium_carterae.1